MLKRIINSFRYIRIFMSCRHEFNLRGTTKRKNEVLIACKCQVCDIEIAGNTKQINKLAKVFSIKWN